MRGFCSVGLHSHGVSHAFSRVFVVVLGLVLVAVAAPNAAASTVRPLNLEELTVRAAQVFAGRCTSVEIVVDEQLGVPVAVATFEVDTVLKGDVVRTVTIRQLPPADGGATSAHVGMAGIAGLPAAQPGEEVLLFLYGATASRLTAPVGLGQGKFALLRDKRGERLAINGVGNRHLFRGLSDAARRTLGLAPGSEADPGALPLDRLASMVRALVAAPGEER